MSNEDAGRHVEDTIIGVELLDGCTTFRVVAFAENLLEVAVQEFVSSSPHVRLRR
jgi:hypothetical protein